MSRFRHQVRRLLEGFESGDWALALDALDGLNQMVSEDGTMPRAAPRPFLRLDVDARADGSFQFAGRIWPRPREAVEPAPAADWETIMGRRPWPASPGPEGETPGG